MRVLELELNCDILQKLFEIKIDHLDTFDEDSNGFEASTKACLDIVDSDTREAAQNLLEMIMMMKAMMLLMKMIMMI